YKEPGVSGNTVLMDYLMNISTAKVAGSAFEAMEMDILQPKDTIVVNAERRIIAAKEEALNMAKAGYTAPTPRTDIPVLGRNTLGTFYAGISGMQFGHYASPHDALIAKKIAYVLCGGDLSGEDNLVSEQYLLDIEREAFLSLLGEKKTLERIQHMLQTGKPLRN
ncbi:MAG: 3-hydroxyacyl-CoA dehydrogenase, partial [Bacteroidota bacterium]